MVTFYQFPRGHRIYLQATNTVGSPPTALGLRTDAARRFKRVDRATAVIWKMPMIAEQRFCCLDAAELLKQVYPGVRYQDGIGVSRK